MSPCFMGKDLIAGTDSIVGGGGVLPGLCLAQPEAQSRATNRQMIFRLGDPESRTKILLLDWTAAVPLARPVQLINRAA